MPGIRRRPSNMELTLNVKAAEWVIPLPCAKRVYDWNLNLIGFCSRERNHKGGCTHLVPMTPRHRLDCGTSLVYYMTEQDYIELEN